MNSNIVLCVDDDAAVLNALRPLLDKMLGEGVTVEVAESGREALELCAEIAEDGKEISVVISDFLMPGMRGDELLVRMHEKTPRTVKIMLTGQSDLDGVKRSINEANLYRFLEKPFNNADLALTAKSALHTYRQGLELEKRNAELERINAHLESLVAERTAELVEKNKQLEKLSVSDRLTGLYNRLRLDQVLDAELVRSKRYGNSFLVILLDVDHFKSVNDTHGHQVGDQVLTQVAYLLRKDAREVDTVGRWGGEEFLIVCPDTSIEGAALSAEKLRQKIAQQSFHVVGGKTCSFGVASIRAEETIDTLIARADAALYRSKHNGRNRVEIEC
jgi:diguanylate cyclase (GGDEF)-like protein